MVTTYVLAGHDYNGGTKETVAAWEKRACTKGDTVIIRPKDGQTLDDVARQIIPPARIIIACHGEKDGSFLWHESASPRPGSARNTSGYDNDYIDPDVVVLPQNGSYRYDELFKLLPRNGIESIIITACHAESAMEYVATLPYGTFLIAQQGKNVYGWGNSAYGTELALQDNITPVIAMLEALDNTSPLRFFKQSIEKAGYDTDLAYRQALKDQQEGRIAADVQLKRRDYAQKNNIPDDVLPQMIGIGGNPPVRLNLAANLAVMAGEGKAGRLDPGALSKAVQQVKTYFDPYDVTDDPSWNGATAWAARHWLNKQVDDTVERLQKGDAPQAFKHEEQRIGYAVMLAYLHHAGTLDRMVAAAIETVAHTATPMQWDKRGDRTVAQLQAIAETVWRLPTDAGGTQDRRVSGHRDATTASAIEQLKALHQLSPALSDQEVLQQLLQDPRVRENFGSLLHVGKNTEAQHLPKTGGSSGRAF